MLFFSAAFALLSTLVLDCLLSRFDISLCLIALLIKCVKAHKKDMKARGRRGWRLRGSCAYAKDIKLTTRGEKEQGRQRESNSTPNSLSHSGPD